MRRSLGWPLALALLVAGCGGTGQAGAAGGRHPAAARASAPGTPKPLPLATAVVRGPDQAVGPPGPAATSGGDGPQPVRLRIPSIGVDSTLAALGLNGDGTIAVPPNYDHAGWYTKGPAPGELGPAVILGHLDSYTGPAVFARLSAVHPGDQVLVSRSDGTVAAFTVQRLDTFPVDAFPTQEVYGATTEPALRLITCGGRFDLGQRRYQANVVVFATLSSIRPAG